MEGFGKGSQEGAKVSIRSCQDLFGCVSISNQKQIADAFDIDEKYIKTIIKFIPSIKQSKVEYEIVYCSGPRCAKNGSMEVLKTVKKNWDWILMKHLLMVRFVYKRKTVSKNAKMVPVLWLTANSTITWMLKKQKKFWEKSDNNIYENSRIKA